MCLFIYNSDARLYGMRFYNKKVLGIKLNENERLNKKERNIEYTPY